MSGFSIRSSLENWFGSFPKDNTESAFSNLLQALESCAAETHPDLAARQVDFGIDPTIGRLLFLYFGCNEDNVRKWLDSEVPALNGRKPGEILESKGGMLELKRVILRLP